MRESNTYWSSLKKVKPMNGSWLPTKALGGGKVSTSPFSISMSSKLLVSMSLFSSGTTGATAGRQKQRQRAVRQKGGSEGGGGQEERKLLRYIKSKLKTVCDWGDLNVKKKKETSKPCEHWIFFQLFKWMHVHFGFGCQQFGVSPTPLLFLYSACFVPRTQRLSQTPPGEKVPSALSFHRSNFKSLQTKMCQSANQIKLS